MYYAVKTTVYSRCNEDTESYYSGTSEEISKKMFNTEIGALELAFKLHSLETEGRYDSINISSFKSIDKMKEYLDLYRRRNRRRGYNE